MKTNLQNLDGTKKTATLIKNIVSNRKKIAKGSLNFLIRKSKIEDMSLERMKHCKTCEHNIKGKCGICGCILKLKTRVPESECALSQIDEEPKWKAEQW